MLALSVCLATEAALADPVAAPEAERGDGPASESVPRSRDTLAVREMILVNQVGFARGTARWRARELYRLLQNPIRDDGQKLAGSDRARVVVAGLNALQRDRQEQAALVGELAAVRAERAAVASAAQVPVAAEGEPGAADAAAPAVPPPAFVAPVDGAVSSPFGPARDAGSGVWLFHPGVRWRARAGEVVRASEAGVVRRVADGEGRRTIVIQHAGNWITILGGLRDVAAGVGQTVTRGQVVGHAAASTGERDGVTLEIWHRRAAVDPATVLRR